MRNKDDRKKDTERTSGLVKGVVVGAAGIGTAIVGAPVVAAAGAGYWRAGYTTPRAT